MIEAAYCAAAVDFDGSVTASSKDLNPRVYVSNMCKEVLDELQKDFGGNVHDCHINERGIIWNWCISGKNVLKFLEYIHPYLRIKKKQAEVAIVMARTLQNNGVKLSDAVIEQRLKYCMYIHHLNKNPQHARKVVE